MEIFLLDSVESTHTYLKNYIKKHSFSHPIAVVTQNQTNGIGSRDNTWDGESGNLFFSFVVHKKTLSDDVPLQSYSIYFSFILKGLLKTKGSKVWLKWPNDFYIGEKKIGGTITTLSGELVYCGIGINLKSTNKKYEVLDIEISIKKFLQEYFLELEKKSSWKDIFSKFLLEFELSKKFETTINNDKVLLKNSLLNSDGSITVNDKKVFSLR